MQGFNWSGFSEYVTNEYLFWGAVTTIWLTAFAIVAGLALGSLLAFMRLSKHSYFSTPARLYIWIFRGTPLLVQLIIIFTGLPQLGIKLSVVESALLGLALNEAAYLAEIIRAGILAVSKGQVYAGMAMGLKQFQVMRYVVMPQAFRIIIPPLGNSVNGLLKTTSVTSVISMEELLRRTQILIQEKFLVLELFLVAAIYYLLMTTVWELVQRKLEARFGRGFDDPLADSDQR